MTYKAPTDALIFEVETHARARWWHEEDLIRDRLSWLLTSHGVIGAGYAWLKHRIAELAMEISKADTQNLKSVLGIYRSRLDELSSALWWIGIVISCFVLLGVCAAIGAQYKLKESYKGAPFELGVSSPTTMAGQLVAAALPALCLIGWKIARDVLG